MIDRTEIERVLPEAESFLVDAEDAAEVGVVDNVVLDDAGRVVRIDVCGGWFGRRRFTFAVGDVLRVSPASRRVIVSTDAVRRVSGGA